MKPIKVPQTRTINLGLPLWDLLISRSNPNIGTFAADPSSRFICFASLAIFEGKLLDIQSRKLMLVAVQTIRRAAMTYS
jgi:hypothetical protein